MCGCNMLILLYVQLAVAQNCNDYCEDSWVLFTQKGDGMCDWECNIAFCEFDIGLAGEWDCEEECLSMGCETTLLGNGVCDYQCQSAACGHDKGDCGYCAMHCSSEMLENNLCDETCNVQRCGYDSGACGQCAPGCDSVLSLGNGVCEEECDVAECLYDAGDCGRCAEECSLEKLGDGECQPSCLTRLCGFDSCDCEGWEDNNRCYLPSIGNNVCDPQCYSAEALWDGGDCDCSPGCSHDLYNNDICDLPCATTSCGWDQGYCVISRQGVCGFNCFDTMLADGFCDAACNTAECGFDHDDCLCSKDCSYLTFASCSDACLVYQCSFGNFGAEAGCTNQFLRDLALATQALKQRYSAGFHLSACMPADPQCTEEVLYDSWSTHSCYSYTSGESSHLVCNNQDCAFSLGYCYPSLDISCLRGFGDGPAECFECKDKYVRLFSTCLQYCPRRYEIRSEQLGLCVPKVDASDILNQDLIYVADSKRDGRGSLASPYGHLGLALLAAWQHYTTIYILGPSVLMDLDSASSNPEIMAMNMNDNKALVRVKITSLTCDQSLTERCSNRNAEIHIIKQVSLPVTYRLILDKVILTSTRLFEGLSVNYCPHLVSIDGVWRLDTGLPATEEYIAASQLCVQFRQYTFMTALSGGVIILRNVIVRNFSIQPKALIEIQGGDVILENVKFLNVTTSQDQAGGLILQSSVCADLVCGSFSYTYGKVMYLNNGLRYASGLHLTPFLFGLYLTSVTLTNVTFEHNLVVDADASSNELSSAALIYLNTFYHLSFTDCHFNANFVTGGLVVVSSNVILPKLTDSSDNAYMYKEASITFTNARITSNLGENSLVVINFHRDVLNVFLSEIEFSYNAVGEQVLLIVSDRNPELSLALGEFKQLVSATTGKLVNMWIAPRSVKITNVQIRYTGSSLALIAIENCANLNFTEVDIRNNGDYDVSAVYRAFQSYAFDPSIIEKTPPDLSQPSSCVNLVYLQGNINTLLHNCTISANFCYGGSCGFSFPKAIGNITATGVTISENECNNENGSGLSVFEDIKLEIDGLTATNNVNWLGAVLFFGMRSDVRLKDLVLQGNQGVYGAGIACYMVQSLTVTGLVMRNNAAGEGIGGGVYIAAGNQYTADYTFRDCLFEGNSADKGGVLVIEAYNLTSLCLRISSSQFIHNSASGYGAALYLDTMLNLQNALVSDCTFSQHSTGSGVLSLAHKSGLLRFANCIFDGNMGRDAAVVFLQTESEAVTIFENVKFTGSAKATTILKANSRLNSTLTTRHCVFQDNEKSDVILENGFWQDFSSFFTYSTVSEFYFSAGAVAALTGTVIRDNSAIYQGGAMHLLTGAVLHCEGCLFLNNSAGHSGGAIYAEQDSTVRVRNSVFRFNSATHNGAVLQLISSVSATSIIESSLIESNYVGELGIVFVQSSSLILSNVTFRSNEGKKCPGVVLMVSRIRIEGCKFSNQTGIQAAFLVALTSTTAFVSNSEFRDARAIDGGCFEISSSNLTMWNSVMASLQGGAIFLNSDCGLILTQVTMTNMSYELEGSLISGLYSSLTVQESTFADFRDTGVYGFQMDSVVLSNSRFASGQGKMGAAFQCYQCYQVRIEKTVFEDLKAEVAGAVSLWALSTSFRGQSFITDSSFVRNSAEVGGALEALNYYLSITRTRFEANIASEGGAVHLGCVALDMCHYEVSASTFANNTAKVKGGGISWEGVKPQFTDLLFTGNEALYGPDVSSYPIRIVLNSVVGRALSQSLILNFPPGQQTPVTLSASVLDHYGQVITIDNSSMAFLTSTNPSFSVLGAAKVQAVQGTFLFNDFKIFAAPASLLNITLNSSAISTDQPGDPDQHVPSILLTFELRDCVAGEAKAAVSCDVCSAGTYSFDPLAPCQNCPAHAWCWGNFTITPEPGYWRSDALSPLIRACLNAEACLGGQVANKSLSLTGYCATGYENNLCQACQQGYSRSGKNTCGKCPEAGINATRITFIMIALILVLAFMVWSTLRASTRPKAEYSILIKIMANYLQLVTLILGFKLKWPEEVIDAYKAQTSVGGTSDQIFSIDCLLQSTTPQQELYYRKMVIMALLPVIFIIASLVFWIAVAWTKKNWVLMRRECAATIVIIFFLILPTLVDALFSLFSCMEIEPNEYWLIADLSLRCWNSTHSKYMWTVGLPGIVVWILGVPLMCLGVLAKNRSRQDEIWLKLQYGFLISGYRRTCYYWEFVILYRKILIIVSAVFITSYIHIRALTIQLILLLAFFLQLQVKPYTTKSLNMTETLAILVADVTIYCGLYYLTEQLSPAASWVFFVFIVTTNLVFFLYWLFVLLRSLISNVTAIQRVLRISNFQDKYMDNFIEMNTMRYSSEMAVFAANMRTCMRQMTRQSLPVPVLTKHRFLNREFSVQDALLARPSHS